MGCCGEKRAELYGRPLVSGAGSGHPSDPPAGRRLRFSVRFRYAGATGMTVQAPVSGKRYRFDRPGAVVEVDLRDRRALAAVPGLVELRY